MNEYIFWIFLTVVLPIVLIIIFYIIPAIRKKAQRIGEYDSFREFLYQNEFIISKCSKYKGIVEMNIDTENKQLALYSYWKSISIILDYKEILDFEVVQDEDTLISSRMSSTITGGLLFGELGAMAGASGSRTIDKVCNTLVLKIYTTDISNPVIVLDFLDNKINTNSSKYQDILSVIDEMVGILKNIKENNRKTERKGNKSKEKVKTSDSNLSKLKELAELKEKGIITEKEFEESKQKILSKL